MRAADRVFTVRMCPYDDPLRCWQVRRLVGIDSSVGDGPQRLVMSKKRAPVSWVDPTIYRSGAEWIKSTEQSKVAHRRFGWVSRPAAKIIRSR